MNCLRRPFQGRALPVSYLGTMLKILRKSGGAWKGKASENCPQGLKPRSRCSGMSELKLRPPKELLHGFVEFAHPVFLLQDFAGLGAVGRAYDAVFFH